MVKKMKILNLALVMLSVVCICIGIAILCHEIIQTYPNSEHDSISKVVSNRVLFISSYGATFYPMDAVKQGRDSALFLPDNMILTDTEYMDTRKYDNSISTDLFYKQLKYKLAHHEPYKAIILGGDNALRFALEHQEELFHNIPMVFFAIHDIDLAIQANNTPFVTGNYEKFSIADTLNVAIGLYPEAKNVVALHDNTMAGKGDMQQFLDLQRQYPSYTFTTLNTSILSLFEIAERLKQLDDDDILLVLSVNEGMNNKYYSTKYVTKFINKYSKIPAFCIEEEGIKNGFLGGVVFDYYGASKKVALIVKSIIADNSSVSMLPMEFDSKEQICFNYNELKRFQISKKSLPDGIVLVNEPLSYWKIYRSSLKPILLILISLSIIIAISIFEYNKKKLYAFELQKSRKKLLHAARHDFLTGLPNRHYAHYTLENSLRAKQEFSLLVIDIDNFKSINDFFSHACGDAVLKEVARRLQEIAQSGGYFVSRFGGDEFVAIYKGELLTAESKEIVRFKSMLDGDFEIDNKHIVIHSSIGVATTSDLLEEDDDIVAFADFALYSAKHNGRNAVSFFDSKMNDEIKKQKKLAEIVELACQNDDFTVLYQPQMNAQTGQIHGYEALVRLKDSYISPADFIPVAEKNGFIGKIGRIVTKKVVQQMVQWRNEGLPLYTVSINYSSGQMGDVEYVQYLHNLLVENKINPQLIKIEITESLCMKNTRQAMHLFDTFSQIGVKLALDDFGTGFSSLSYLTYLPVDTVKIDKTMTDTYLIDGKDDFIENIISLVHSLGMKLTAEGVEQQWQYNKLKEFHCDSIQGYYFSRPITGEVVCESLHDGRF